MGYTIVIGALVVLMFMIILTPDCQNYKPGHQPEGCVYKQKY